MEIRILMSGQLPEAVGLSRNVFDFCLRNTIADGQMTEAFEKYVRPDYLSRMVEEGHLTVWGAFEQGMMVGVSAMQAEGHITMLYVLPMYQRRGIGRKLLLEMRKYAKNVNNLSMVTLNAMPAWTASYFSRRKFRPMDSTQMANAPFVSMQAQSIEEVSYDKKPLSSGMILGTVFSALGICILIVVLGLANLLY